MRLLLLLLLWLPFVSALDISEVMYNPVGDDAANEFVEIFGADNLSNYTFGDLAVNQTLTLISFVPGNFSLLVPSGFSVVGLNASVYTTGAKLGNGLGNSGDTLFLYENGSVVTSVSYTSAFGNGDGLSVEFLDGQPHSSTLVGGTPGYFYSSPSLCLSDLSVALSSAVVNLSETLSFTFTATSFETLEYWIRTADQIVKPALNTTSLSAKSFTPDAAGLYFLEARLFSSCNVSSLSVPFFVSGTTALEPSFKLRLRQRTASFGAVLAVPVTVAGENVSVTLRLANDSVLLAESTPLVVSGVMKTTLLLPLPSDCLYAAGTYTLSLGDDVQDITLRSSCAATSLSPITQDVPVADVPFSMTLLSSNLTFLVNTTTPLVVNVSAGSDAVSGTLWGYVYAHSRTLSGNRSGNMVSFSLAPFTSQVFTIPVRVELFKPEASLKLQWQTNLRKTIAEQKFSVALVEPSALATHSTTLIKPLTLPAATGQAVYIAPEVTVQRVGSLLVGVLAFVLLCVGLWSVFRKQWHSLFGPS